MFILVFLIKHSFFCADFSHPMNSGRWTMGIYRAPRRSPRKIRVTNDRLDPWVSNKYIGKWRKSRLVWRTFPECPETACCFLRRSPSDRLFCWIVCFPQKRHCFVVRVYHEQFQETILFMVGLTSKVLLRASVAPCSLGLEKNNLEFIPKIKSPKSGNSIEKPWIHLTSTSINIHNIASLENNNFFGVRSDAFEQNIDLKKDVFENKQHKPGQNQPKLFVDRTLLGVQQIPKLHREASGRRWPPVVDCGIFKETNSRKKTHDPWDERYWFNGNLVNVHR